MSKHTLGELTALAVEALKKKDWTVIYMMENYHLHLSIRMRVKLCKYNKRSKKTAEVYCYDERALIKWAINKGIFECPSSFLHTVLRKNETKLVYKNGNTIQYRLEAGSEVSNNGIRRARQERCPLLLFPPTWE